LSGCLRIAARHAGLDFIAITDHNNLVHQIETPRPGRPGDPLVISGEEVTTPGGHANVWGLGARGWVDFRVMPGNNAPEGHTIDDLVRAASQQGALFSINHPDATCDACGWTHAIPEGLDAIEIWNGQRGIQPKGIELWDRLLRAGLRVAAVGSSDWHRPPAPIGEASVRVRASALSTAAILEGIRRGRVIVTADPKIPTPVFLARAGSAIATVGDTVQVARGQDVAIEMTAAGLASGRVDLIWNGVLVETQPLAGDGVARFRLAIGENGYLRAVVRSSDGEDEIVALTNPIWVGVRK